RPIMTRSISATKASSVFPIPRSRRKLWRRAELCSTFDLDFGDILATAGSDGPSVIIFRLRDQTPAAVNPRLFQVIADCAEELASGAVVIVEDERFRVRRLPIRP